MAVGSPGPGTNVIPLPCDPLLNPPCPPPEWGRAFVFSGQSGGLILRLIPDDLDFWQYGASLAPLGDVNGDGIPDVAVGCPVFMHYWGKVYAFSGADGAQLWMTSEPGAKQGIASFGASLAETGDLTGDGRTDVLVGALFHDYDPDPDDSVWLMAGRAYVLSGSDGTIFRTHDNPTPARHDSFGTGPVAIGDQDGDGVEDYAIGEAGAGMVHLYSGSTGGIILDIASPGDGSIDYFGFRIAQTDDKDGDSLDDFWVAAPKAGSVYLMNSYGDVLVQIDDPNLITSGVLGGFGCDISGTEDLDDDGGLDLIVGKSIETAGGFNKAGAVFLVVGVSLNSPPVSNAGLDQIVEQESYTGTEVILDGSASTDVDSTPGTNDDINDFDWFEADTFLGNGEIITYTFPLGSHTVTLLVTDGYGESDEDEVIILVQDTTPPEITCPGDVTVEQESYAGTVVALEATATDNCDPNPAITSNELAVYPLGVTMVTFTATDASGNSATCSMTVTVVDTTPPTINSVSAGPDVLWPPNHKMVEVTVTVDAEDICDPLPVCNIVNVTSNEPINGPGDGNTEPDWEITGDLTVKLRAECAGGGSGRVYTIHVECTDASGNTTAATAEVTVPHDQGKGKGKK